MTRLTPADNPAILKEWKELEKRLVKTMSAQKAYHKIAKNYECTYGAVSYWMKGKYSKKPKSAISRTEYYLKYKRTVRGLDKYIKEWFPKKGKRFSINTLIKALHQNTGIYFERNTIEKALELFKDKTGYSPLVKAGGTHEAYQLSHKYYKYISSK